MFCHKRNRPLCQTPKSDNSTDWLRAQKGKTHILVPSRIISTALFPLFEHFDFGIRESFLPRVLIPYLSSEWAHWGCPSTCPLQSSSTTWEAQGCIFGQTATVPASDPQMCMHASSQFLAFWRMSNIDLPPKLGQYKLKQKLFSRNEKLISFKVGFENRFWESGTRSWPKKRRLVGEVV